MALFLSQDSLLAWLAQLQQQYRLIAPVAMPEGVTLFQPVRKVEELALGYETTELSPKDCFFPPSEVLFAFKKGEIELPPPPPETVLFGLHPCDALGIAQMDAPFLSSPTDSYYQERRERTTLVGLGCVNARPECFCTSLGTGPHDPTHLDILLLPVDGGSLIAGKTDKGEKLLSRAMVEERPLSPPPPPSLPSVPVEGIERVAPLAFDHPYWGRLADRCLHCNICAYVCPACYCFDIRDYNQGGKQERVRSWESCQSPGFTRLAGGYEPRPSKGAKLRQRFYHKFFYFHKQFGLLGCTGCGRCVRACPVNIDIREVITEMQRIGAETAVAQKRR